MKDLTPLFLLYEYNKSIENDEKNSKRTMILNVLTHNKSWQRLDALVAISWKEFSACS